MYINIYVHFPQISHHQGPHTAQCVAVRRVRGEGGWVPVGRAAEGL